MFNIHKYIHPEVLPRDLGGDLMLIDKSWLYNALYEREIKQGRNDKRMVSKRNKVLKY